MTDTGDRRRGSIRVSDSAGALLGYVAGNTEYNVYGMTIVSASVPVLLLLVDSAMVCNLQYTDRPGPTERCPLRIYCWRESQSGIARRPTVRRVSYSRHR